MLEILSLWGFLFSWASAYIACELEICSVIAWMALFWLLLCSNVIPTISMKLHHDSRNLLRMILLDKAAVDTIGSKYWNALLKNFTCFSLIAILRKLWRIHSCSMIFRYGDVFAWKVFNISSRMTSCRQKQSIQQIGALCLLIMAAVLLSVGEGSNKDSSGINADQKLFNGIIPVLVASVLSGLASSLCQWASQVIQSLNVIFLKRICSSSDT